MLVVTDSEVALRDGRAMLEHVLARIDWREDLIVLGETAQDTLDYTGPRVNRGSKAILLATGDARVPLPSVYEGSPPPGTARAVPFCRGCLVVEGRPFVGDRDAADRVARHAELAAWPLVVLVDDAAEATRSTELFLWTTFTRMEPAADIHARDRVTARFHTGLVAPVVIDARMKPGYPEVMEVDAATRALVDRRWTEYGIPG